MQTQLRRLGDCATRTISAIRNFLNNREEGATLTEYALLIGLIVLGCLAGMAAIGGHIGTIFTRLANSFTSNGGS